MLDRFGAMSQFSQQQQQQQQVQAPAAEPVGHMMWGKLSEEYDRTFLPVPRSVGEERGLAVMGGHFLWVMGICVLSGVGSILLGSAMGAPAAVGATLGIQMVIVGVYHAMVTYVGYKVAQPYNLMLHTNPVISLLELIHGTAGWVVALTQILGQAMGYAVAALACYGILMDGSLFTKYVSAELDVTRTSVGGLFGLEFMAGFFFGWLLWHNFVHRIYFLSQRERLGIFAESSNLPAALATMTGVTTAIVYAFGGVSTHNVFRFLSGCILASGATGSTCGSTGSWVYMAASAIGLLVAVFAHNLTQSMDGDGKKFRYQEMLEKAKEM